MKNPVNSQLASYNMSLRRICFGIAFNQNGTERSKFENRVTKELGHDFSFQEVIQLGRQSRVSDLVAAQVAFNLGREPSDIEQGSVTDLDFLPPYSSFAPARYDFEVEGQRVNIRAFSEGQARTMLLQFISQGGIPDGKKRSTARCIKLAMQAKLLPPEIRLDPNFITDGRKLEGKAMPGIVGEFQAQVVGKRIVAAGYVRGLSGSEVWPAMMLEDGTEISAGRDDEGNGPGVMMASSAILCQTSLKQ